MTYKQIKQEIKYIPEVRIKWMIYLFRISRLLTYKRNPVVTIFGRIIGSFYAFYSAWILNIDLSYNTNIGEGLVIHHGMGLVINPSTIIGRNPLLRQNTTIGINLRNQKAPVIGDNVDIGANSVIIGDISIGNNCFIGAGSVVTKSVPDNCVVVGNPAYIIKKDGVRCKESL